MNETQEKWPFGPAPQRECSAGGEHEWIVIDLFRAAEPPAPSFECIKCHYRWSRTWTRSELERFAEGDEYYLRVLDNFPTEAPYATT